MRTSLVTIALTVVLFGTTSNARGECVPTAIPVGDASIVKALSERLAANGIKTAAIAGCPVVRVNVEQRGEQLHLKLIDAFQRRGVRSVQDVATAAAVIESWTLQVVVPGALPEMPGPVATVVVAAAPMAISTTSIIAGGRSWLGNDGSTWVGASVGACRRVGWSCLGGAMDFGSDTSAVDDFMTGTHRSLALHVLATADVPRKLGSFTVSPGVSLGYGWNRIQQQHHDVVNGPISVSHANHALRTGAHLNVSRSIGHYFALSGGVFGDVATLRTEIPDGPRGRFGVSFGARLETP